MFSYYGAKTKIIDIYDKPIFNKVIEPFAGSARYALKYWDRDIQIIEKFEPIYRVWRYLQDAKEKDILSLPDVEPHQELSKLVGFNNLKQEERWLIGLCSNRGSNAPKNFSGGFCSWNKDKKRIADNLYKIRKWNIVFGDYSQCENEESTWFIDPPYQNMGKLYKENKIDYNHLSEWCRSRVGQVIVCENSGADWMDFRFLRNVNGQRKKSIEVVWTNEK